MGKSILCIHQKIPILSIYKNCMFVIGMNHAELEGLYLPSFKMAEKGAESQQQKHNSLMDRGNSACLKQGPGETPTVYGRGQTGHGSSLCS